MKPEIEKIIISTDDELENLLTQFQNGVQFAKAFEFKTNILWNSFLDAVGINIEDFNNKYFYYDKNKEIHISESSDGYVWISTMGLVAKARATDNKFINTCRWQKVVLIHLLNDAISLANDENSYDIDGYNYSLVEELTPALFHNTIFYFETLAKAYLSVNGQDVPQTHKLETLFGHVKNTMFKKQQNNTLFHAHIIPAFERVVEHINSIPRPFKEQYIKYDANPFDATLIEFHPDHLKEIRDLVEITCDMVDEMYYDPSNCVYLGHNLYQKLIEKCQTTKEKENLANVYGFLMEEV